MTAALRLAAHWIDTPAVPKCRKVPVEWEGFKVRYTEPGWYALIKGIEIPVILLVDSDIENQFDLCRKCEPLPTPRRRPETVEELLEAGTIEFVVKHALGTKFGPEIPGEIAELIREELQPPPPLPGSWKAEDLALWQGEDYIADAFEDSSSTPYDLARGRLDSIVEKLNVFELDQERWKRLANALQAYDELVSREPQARSVWGDRQQLLELLRWYRDGRQEVAL